MSNKYSKITKGEKWGVYRIYRDANNDGYYETGEITLGYIKVSIDMSDEWSPENDEKGKAIVALYKGENPSSDELFAERVQWTTYGVKL